MLRLAWSSLCPSQLFYIHMHSSCTWGRMLDFISHHSFKSLKLGKSITKVTPTIAKIDGWSISGPHIANLMRQKIETCFYWGVLIKSLIGIVILLTFIRTCRNFITTIKLSSKGWCNIIHIFFHHLKFIHV